MLTYSLDNVRVHTRVCVVACVACARVCSMRVHVHISLHYVAQIVSIPWPYFQIILLPPEV